MTRALLNPYAACPLAGKSFGQVFVPEPTMAMPQRWRVKGSGCKGPPERHPATQEVLRICWDAGLRLNTSNSGSPANASSFHRDCAFLGGGFHARTGNYWFGEKGAWIHGAHAVLFIALAMNLNVRSAWRKQFNLEGVWSSHLEEQLRREIHEAAGAASI